MNSIKRILIIRFSSIGDIVLTTPLLRLLRKKFPTAEIDFVLRAEFMDIVAANPYLHKIYSLPSQEGFYGLRRLKRELKTRKYDLVLDLHNSLRSRYLRWCLGRITRIINKRVVRRFFLVQLKWNMYRSIVSVPQRYIETVENFGIEDDREGLELYVSDALQKQVDQIMLAGETTAENTIVGICPSAKHKTKQWLPERFAELSIQLWREKKVHIALFGGVEDKELCDTLAEMINTACEAKVANSYAGVFSMMETAAALRRCGLVVTNDSGLMHIASAFKRNVVAIFGPTVREFGFFPYGTTARVVEQNGLSCRPCSHIGKEQCPKKHFRCMREITTENVLNVCLEFLD